MQLSLYNNSCNIDVYDYRSIKGATYASGNSLCFNGKYGNKFTKSLTEKSYQSVIVNGITSLIGSNLFHISEFISKLNSIKQNLKFLSPKDVLVFKTLCKLKSMSIDEYMSLSESERELLRKEYKLLLNDEEGYLSYGKFIIGQYNKISFEEVEKMHMKSAKLIEKYLNTKYGNGNYRVIILGRSLSSIGKCLSYKIGEDNVINISLSKAGRYNKPQYIEKLKERGALQKFKKYLASLGLDKEEISSSHKKYILMDYCYTGDSIQGAMNLLKNDSVLGDCKIDIIDVSDCLPVGPFKNKFLEDLRCLKYKPFSHVERCENIDKIGKNNINKLCHNKKIQLLQFKLLDNVMLNK